MNKILRRSLVVLSIVVVGWSSGYLPIPLWAQCIICLIFGYNVGRFW